MIPDFIKIEREKVGYTLEAVQPGGQYRLENLSFEKFISPFAYKAETPQQVYKNLEQALASAIKQQDSVIDGKRSVMIDMLATATLQREAMRNSMGLIKKYYL